MFLLLKSHVTCCLFHVHVVWQRWTTFRSLTLFYLIKDQQRIYFLFKLNKITLYVWLYFLLFSIYFILYTNLILNFKISYVLSSVEDGLCWPVLGISRNRPRLMQNQFGLIGICFRPGIETSGLMKLICTIMPIGVVDLLFFNSL